MRHVPQTSIDAYHSLDPAKLKSIRLRVLASIARCPGTSMDVAARLPVLSYPQVWRRCSELKNQDLVEAVGEVQNEETGKLAELLAVTPKGASVLNALAAANGPRAQTALPEKWGFP